MLINPKIAAFSRMKLKPPRTLWSGDSFFSAGGLGRARMKKRQTITLRKLKAST